MKRRSMGILSGMLIVAGIAFFGKKKLPSNNTPIEKNKDSITLKDDVSNPSIENSEAPKDINSTSTIDIDKK
jgi:hypothetical protein